MIAVPSLRARLPAIAALVMAISAACQPGVPATTSPTSPVVAGSSAQPREINLIAKDYLFLPDAIELVPGETVLLHVINGGLAVHEAIFGDQQVQDAWEIAEAATVGAAPGPTPLVSVPPEVAGVRVVVASGERVDLIWTVPPGAASAGAWIVGCHIPGHWAKGMQVPVRWITGSNGKAPESPAS